MWAGLALSYTVPALPPSFAILAVATGGYALALLRTSQLHGVTSAVS
jgi:zinc/manganese transport system permease protein